MKKYILSLPNYQAKKLGQIYVGVLFFYKNISQIIIYMILN